MKRLFSFLFIFLFVFSWSVNYAADKKDESNVKLSKVMIKHSIPAHKIGTKDAYFEEGFEGDFPPTGWQNLGNEATWQQSTTAFSGSYAAYHNDDDVSAAEYDTLMTPAIDLSTAFAPVLSFVQKNNYVSYYDYHGVLVSVDGINWNEVYSGVAASDWEEISIALNEYVGYSVFVAFVYYGDYADEWYIDDVSVAEAPADPILSINYDSINFGLVNVDSTKEYYGFIVKNDGGGTLEFTSVTGFEGTDFYTDFDATITLGAGEADTFAIGFQPLSEGDQSASLIIESNGGVDTITTSGFGVDVSTKYVEGFEEDVPPTDWEANVISGDYNWEQYAASYAIDGENIARYNSYSASSGSSAELITPKLDVTGNENPYFAFYFGHPSTYYSDTLQVYVGYNDTNWVYVSTLLVQDYYWHSYIYYLNDYLPEGYDPTTVKVKFVAYSAYGTYLLLDHVILPPKYVSEETVDWCNLQWPGEATVTQGDSLAFYGQVYESGVTEGEGQGEGIEVWFGLNTENTDPSTWAEDAWEGADYNEFGPTGSNDEYMFGSVVDLPAGTYYYTFRYRYNGGPYTYGGFSATGGGFWDGTTNVSGVLTVNPLVVSEFPYFEGFESGNFPPTGWYNEDEFWMLGTEAYEGSYCAKANYTHNGEAILTTTPFVLSDTDPMYISFYWKDDDITGKVVNHDTTYFEISNDFGVTWTTLGFLSEESHDTQYHLFTYVLDNYLGQTVVFRWRDVTDATGSAWGVGVDNILIDYYVEGPGEAFNPNPEDGATDVPLDQVVTWENPEGTFYNIGFASFNDPTPVENMDTTAIVFNGAIDTTVYSESGPEEGFPGETTVYWRVVEYAEDGTFTVGPVWSFTTEVDMHPAPFDFAAYSGIGNITTMWNYVAPPEPGAFFESFEDNDVIPEGWQAIDNDGDTYNWDVWNLFAHSGSNSVASFSYVNGVGALNPDNWLITPQIALGETPELTFFAGASDTNWYLEHFQVLISTTDDTVGSFTDVVLDQTLETAEFTQFTVDLSAYANQSIYIAFVHNNVTDQFNLSIDDIAVTGIADGKDLNFAFENPNDIKQFKLVSTTHNYSSPLKRTENTDLQSYKERLDKFFNTPKYKKSDNTKSFDHFNIYRNDEVIANTSDLFYNDTELPQYNTTYGYYVTAVYDDGVESNPSNVDSAYALDPDQVIFINDFEDGELPSYYTVLNANEDDYTWGVYQGYANSGNYSLAVRWNSSMAMDDWVFIGPIQMYSGENYNLNFGYRAASTTWHEKMAVYVASAIDTNSSMMYELFRNEDIGNTEYEFVNQQFQLGADGQYYIAFHGFSDPDMFRLIVDDILLMGNGELVQQQDSSIVFFDDFENGTDNWQLLGAWGLTESESFSPTHSFTESPNGNYPDNAVYLATMTEGVDLSNYYDAQVEFMTKYWIEQGFDYMYLEITYDGAKSWFTLEAFDGVVEDWTPVVVPLGGYVGKTGVKLRFRFVSDAGYNMDGMYIDDFTIRVSNEDTTPPLVIRNCPADYEGTIGDFIFPAQITDISGVASANIIYALAEDTTTIYSAPADSVMEDMYYFHIPEQEPGTMVYFGLAVADSAGNVDTVGTDAGPCVYIAGNYLNFDDNEVTYVLNIPTNYAVAKRISVPGGYETHLVDALIRNYTDAGRPNGNIKVHVWADNNGVPGEDLIEPFEMVPAANLDNPYEMTVADLRDLSDQLWFDGDFWIGFSVPGDEVWLTLGRELDDTRSFVYDPTNGQWAMYSREFQFRAITDQFYPAGSVENQQIPKKFELMQNYPNPFNPTTVIKYALPKEAHVTLKVYNALGQEVATLLNKTVDAGYHEITFDASNLASGMYIYRIEAGNYVSVKKMLLLK